MTIRVTNNSGSNLAYKNCEATVGATSSSGTTAYIDGESGQINPGTSRSYVWPATVTTPFYVHSVYIGGNLDHHVYAATPSYVYVDNDVGDSVTVDFQVVNAKKLNGEDDDDSEDELR